MGLLIGISRPKNCVLLLLAFLLPTVSHALSSVLPTTRETLSLSSLSLEPMLGRYPPHRAPANVPLPETANLDSIVVNDDNQQQCRTSFDPTAQVHLLKGAWSPTRCAEAVRAAADYGQWTTGRHHLFPTTDVPAAELPGGMGEVCLELATDIILPHMAAAFDTPLERLSFKDLFLAKYEPSGQPGLGKHTDGSALSFNVLLSDDFDGGGTWIEPVGVVKPKLGEVLMHRGSLLHEGCKVTKGSRHVLVGFVQDDSIKEKEESELIRATVPNFETLGMVLEVDEGDAVSCVMVTDIAEDGAAHRAGVRMGDCLRGIFGDEDRFVPLDGMEFDSVMDTIVKRRGLGALSMVMERWCE